MNSNQSDMNNIEVEILCIFYSAVPFVDTAAIAVSKRINYSNELVDLIQNDISNSAKKDNSMNEIYNNNINNQIMLSVKNTSSDWKYINEFKNKVYEKIKNKKYKKMFSSSFWVQSHFAAYEYKKNNKNVKWSAEFSDPNLYGITSELLLSEFDVDKYFYKEIKYLKECFDFDLNDANLRYNVFYWAELLPYLFADEIIFTNKNQMEYMLDYFNIDALKEEIEKKSIIMEYPTLDSSYYNRVKTRYKLDNKKINFAYFGSFYSNRGFQPLIEALKEIADDDLGKIRIHIFTKTKDIDFSQITRSKLKDIFYINRYVDYFEFLNLTNKFDVLLINDTLTKGHKKVNPYIPSKYNDYIGSDENKIWGLVENGSTLSTKEIKYMSDIYDKESIKNTLNQIIMDNLK